MLGILISAKLVPHFVDNQKKQGVDIAKKHFSKSFQYTTNPS